MFEDINLKTAQEIKEDTSRSIVQDKKDELIRIKNEIEELSNSGSYANRTIIKHDEVVEFLTQKGYKIKKHSYREYIISWE